MAEGLNDTALNAGATAIKNLIGFLSLHTATPSASGSNESTAARKAATWGTVATGDFSLSAPVNFTGGAANGPVVAVGYWSAATGGTFYGYRMLTGDTTFNSAGEYTVSALAENSSSS